MERVEGNEVGYGTAVWPGGHTLTLTLCYDALVAFVIGDTVASRSTAIV